MGTPCPFRGVVCVRRCCGCPDRALCDVLDDADVQFWPPEDRVAEVSRRLGREVGPEEVERVEACLLAGRWLPSDG
jgi:hypothetical protein